MSKHNNEKCSKSNNDMTLKSSNLIPKTVRKLFKEKIKSSKKMKTVKSVKQCIMYRKRILDIDISLKKSYKTRQDIIENKVFEKAKLNKKRTIFLHQIKAK